MRVRTATPAASALLASLRFQLAAGGFIVDAADDSLTLLGAELTMVEPGDQIVVSESQGLTFLRTGAETDGELLEVRATYRPDSPEPPAHYHPNQEERFEVLRGTFEAVIDGEEAVYTPGDSFTVPQGAVHWMRNIASEPGELGWEIRPALRTASFFTAFWGLEREHGGAEAGPDLLQAAVLLPEFYDEFRLASPPFLVQRLLFGILAPLGGALGYRTSAAFSVEESAE